MSSAIDFSSHLSPGGHENITHVRVSIFFRLHAQTRGNFVGDCPYLFPAFWISLQGKTLRRRGNTDRTDNHSSLRADRRGDAAQSLAKLGVVRRITLPVDFGAGSRQVGEGPDRLLGIDAQRRGTED